MTPPSGYKPLLDEPDAEDFALWKANAHPGLLTDRLRELVPLLRFVGARVTRADEDGAVLTVDLLETAMNQNGTHQAAVFYLLADYVLGVAMWAALPGTYTVGVHDRCHALPIQFWLKGGTVEHLLPGTGPIRGEVALPPDTRRAMRSELRGRGRADIKEVVKIYQGDALVARAEHEMGVYADLPRVAGERASITQVFRMKTSALMIAGLRDDDLSRRLAEAQGIAIATRMTRASPQLPGLVRARSEHVNAYLDSHGGRFTQIVVLGVGLDVKPITYAHLGARWFLCDLREMLRERKDRLRRIGADDGRSNEVALDLRRPDWPERLLRAGFEPSSPGLVVLEGVSMYLTRDELRQTLGRLRGLMAHPESRLWIDHVTGDLLRMPTPEVVDFLRSMARLGEPFVTGADSAEELAGPEWRIDRCASAAGLVDSDDPVFGEYRFALLAARCTDR